MRINPTKAILTMVDNEYDSNINFSSILNNKREFELIMRIAKKNGLSYLFIQNLVDKGIGIPFLDKNFDKNRLKHYKNAIIRLKSLEDNEIRYVVIKDSNKIPHIPNDIDLFLKLEDKENAIQTLKKEGMECIRSDNIETILKGKNVKIDLYTRIEYFGIECIDANFLLDSTIKSNVFDLEYNGLNNEANFLILMIHSLFGHGTLTLLDFLHLKALMLDLDIDICRNYAIKKGWGYSFDKVMSVLDEITNKIYIKNEVVTFPYGFGFNFLIKCVSHLEGLELTWKNKFFLYISLIWDLIVHNKAKNSRLYDALRSVEPIRRFINYIGYSIRSMRGDKYS